MRSQRRATVLFVFAAMILVSLACTLGGEASVSPTETAAAQISPTLPPAVTIINPSDTPSPTVIIPPATSTNTPTPSATPIVGNGPGGCVLRGTYIADVTIPDGTLLAPNAAFVKTWRVRNDGTCSWDAGYQLVYASGNQMSGPAAVNIPPAGPGQIIDVSVNLVAPGATGDHSGTWRLRASNNAIFGGYTVIIKVVGTPTPTPSPTTTPTLTGGGIWGGTWETSCPGSDCGQMNLVQTGNTVVGTYAGGAGTINGSVNGNRLAGTWARGSTSGTFDFWIEADAARWHGNWNNTQAWCGHRAGQSDLSPCGVSRWYGTWATNCESGAPCGEMILNQVGDTITGTYAGTSGKITGTVNGSVLQGTWTRNPGSPSEASGALKFYLAPDGTQFQGNFSGSNYWCGYKGSGSFPDPCFKP